MPLRRTTCLLAGLLLGASLGLPPASAAPAAVVKPIAFPVDGKVTYTDTFGAPRSGGRTHEGQDLMGAKMTRLVAAVSGEVYRIKFDNLSTGGNSVVIKADDGWTYHYLHVNNDTPGTDDGKASRDQAFPPSIVLGARVTKGQLVAYMGDSGNAEATAPHLHFEIRQPAAPGAYTGTAINAYPSLKAAEQGTPAPSRWTVRRSPTAGGSDASFAYGRLAGDRGLLCDWDADGVDEAVVYRDGVWHLRAGVESGANERQVTFGAAADTPLCGDFDGRPGDEPALFRNGIWTVRDGFDAAAMPTRTVRYGIAAGDRPVLGDWDGDGRDDLAILRLGGQWLVRSGADPTGTIVARFTLGKLATDLPIAGDWDGDGRDDAGLYRTGQWYLRSTAAADGSTSPPFGFGPTGAAPLVGYGVDPNVPGIGAFTPAG